LLTAKSMRLEHATFATMTLILLWFSDAFYLYASLSVARLWNVAWVILLILISFYLYKKRKLPLFNNKYLQWVGLYAFLIMLIGLMHTVALLSIPSDMLVNTEGMTAAHTLRRNFGFLFFYLCFPAFIYVLYSLLQHLNIKIVVFWVTVTISISCLILYYQVFVNPDFFHINIGHVDAGWYYTHRFDGFSSNPNDFALALFLTLPLLIVGIELENKKWARFIYLLIIPVIMGALHYTGCRSALAGAIIFILSLPILVALLQKHWSKKTRGFFLALPLVPILLFSIFQQAGLINFQGETGLNRLLRSIQTFQTEGISQVYVNSYRDRQASIAVNLTIDSPLGGWGPGGFFREQSNAIFHSAGLTEKTIETALNYYLNIASDFGIPLLMLLMLLLLWPVRLGVQACRRCPDHKQRMVLGILVLGNIIFMLVIITMPPTFMLEPFWLWALLIVL